VVPNFEAMRAGVERRPPAIPSLRRPERNAERDQKEDR